MGLVGLRENVLEETLVGMSKLFHLALVSNGASDEALQIKGTEEIRKTNLGLS
jgi:hypothetical protein